MLSKNIMSFMFWEHLQLYVGNAYAYTVDTDNETLFISFEKRDFCREKNTKQKSCETSKDSRKYSVSECLIFLKMSLSLCEL